MYKETRFSLLKLVNKDISEHLRYNGKSQNELRNPIETIS